MAILYRGECVVDENIAGHFWAGVRYRGGFMRILACYTYGVAS